MITSRKWLYGAAWVIAAMWGLAVAPAWSAVVIDLVPVGNSGNAADPATGGFYGAVTGTAWIGKYEVTIGQYAAFLNAVGATDPYGLYDSNLQSNGNIAGIIRSGSSGSYTYTVTGPAGVTPSGASSPSNRPITYLSWFDCARFANWMANGQPAGAPGSTTTENGAYALNGAISGTAPWRNATNPNTGSAPIFTLPSENLWYKAAYYSPVLNSGSGGYYTYATQSNTTPGNTIGSLSNQANYALGNKYAVTQASSWSSSQNYLTEVGAFTNSASYYGTFDQSGNVREWIDTISNMPALRGGPWGNPQPLDQSSTDRVASNPADNVNFVSGFRLSSPIAVPEPSTWVIGFVGLACGTWRALRRRDRR